MDDTRAPLKYINWPPFRSLVLLVLTLYLFLIYSNYADKKITDFPLKVLCLHLFL